MHHGRAAILTSESVGSSLPGQWSGRAILRPSLDLKLWLFVLLALGLVSALAFVHLGQISYVARQVEQMKGLERELLELKQGNNALRLEIAQLEQLPRLKAQAESLGLGKPEHVEYVEVPIPQAVSTKGDGLVSTIVGGLTAGVSPSPTWWIQATRQFGSWAQVSSEPAVEGVAQVTP